MRYCRVILAAARVSAVLFISHLKMAFHKIKVSGAIHTNVDFEFFFT